MKTVNDIVMKLLVPLKNSTVRNVWERKAPDLDAVLRNIAMLNKSSTSTAGTGKGVVGMIV